MKGKTCLITGSTDGIGLATAKALLTQGAKVILHGRNATKGQQALEAAKQETGSDLIEFIQADFSSLEEVRRMANTLHQHLDKLDVLINNAGVSSTAALSYSQDGHELTFAVNHLAPFLLTNLLIDSLKSATHARVVNLSSVGHKFAPFDINDLMCQNTKPSNAYFRSKFANIVFSNELSRRYHTDGICSNALHPGTVKSNFGKEAKQTALFYKLASPFLKTVEQGAATSIYLASSSEMEGKTGGYYKQCKLAKPSPATNDAPLAKQLWLHSEKLVGLA